MFFGQEFTRFWALFMFGSYSVCNIIVLLNMLIAMMSNRWAQISTYQVIQSIKKYHNFVKAQLTSNKMEH